MKETNKVKVNGIEYPTYKIKVPRWNKPLLVSTIECENVCTYLESDEDTAFALKVIDYYLPYKDLKELSEEEIVKKYFSKGRRIDYCNSPYNEFGAKINKEFIEQCESY